MEHLSQLEPKTPVVTRREHKGRRDDKMAKRESLGSFTMRDKSWRTGSPEMYVWIYAYVTAYEDAISKLQYFNIPLIFFFIYTGSVYHALSLCIWREIAVLRWAPGAVFQP